MNEVKKEGNSEKNILKRKSAKEKEKNKEEDPCSII